MQHELEATVVLQTRNHDEDAEDEGVRVSAELDGTATGDNVATAIAGIDAAETKDIKIDDDEEQKYVLALDPRTQKLNEGDDVTVSLKADPPHEQASTRLTLNLRLNDDDPGSDYSLAITSTGTAAATAITGSNVVTIGAADATNAVATATITISTPDNDENRKPDTLELKAYSGQPGAEMLRGTSGEIVLKDAHALPMVTAKLVDANGDAVTDEVTEGMNYMLTLTVVDEDGDATAAAEDLTVTLTASGDAVANNDYSLPMTFMIAEGDMSSEARTLEVDLNDDLNDESLIISATVNGDNMTYGPPQPGLNPMEVLSLTIVDDTDRHVWVKDGAEAVINAVMTAAQGTDGQINPDDDFVIPKSALFEAATGYSRSGSVRCLRPRTWQ